MLIRQLFDRDTFTYTYLLADVASNEALLIDPVFEQTELYLQLLNELGLTLKYALDTHVHADHITALGSLRERIGCKTVVNDVSGLACADTHVKDGDIIQCGNFELTVITTPGHTDDSMCFYLAHQQGYLFSGDTLLIRGTGRTDFQNGSSEKLYNSLFTKILTLNPNTVVYPGHDYKGWTESTIAEEKANNPRLQVNNSAEFVEIMSKLKLASPKMMDVAIPANLQCGNKMTEPFDESKLNVKRHTALFSTSDQISLDDIQTAANKGYTLIVNNRPDNETDDQPTSLQMAAAAKAAGINYTYIPIQRELPQADIQLMSEQLQHAQGAALAYCRTGTRSTNLWLMTLNKQEQNQAMEHAKVLGYDLALAKKAMQS
ncbi:MAG: hypothetical protein ACJA0N_002525 [Pseudohongiellaceae bacterium]|jgi:uncharacterized protein (TIGR01244 family)